MSGEALIEAVRRGLAGAADASKAPGMQAYMKSAMPFLGVQAPALRQVCREVFPVHPLSDFDEWRRTCLELWRSAVHREERYAAIELSGHRLYRAHQLPRAIPMYEEMITDGAWWDYVDAVAIQRVGPILRSHPAAIKPLMREWSVSDDMWKRRSSIICQAGAKADTDLELLYGCIAPSLHDKRFFIRKAIGWALRSYAWVDPAEVVRYVDSVSGRISPLSRREALKNVSREPAPGASGARPRRATRRSSA
jgi:3-methyladenine DNA glycosylase AlkD